MRMLIFVATLSLLACAQDVGTDLRLSPGYEGQLSDAKADGAFGSESIRLGQEVRSGTASAGLVIYSLELTATDIVRVRVARASGDIVPEAFVYEGINTFLPPADIGEEGEQLTLNYTIADDGEHFIVVRAGSGSGDFTLIAECLGGACAEEAPTAHADRCILDASHCALEELPRYNGRVGAVRAANLFNECLIANDETCATACDEAELGAAACAEAIGALPVLADEPAICLSMASECLRECEFAAPSGAESVAHTCWLGNDTSASYCADFIERHSSCGGGDFALGTVNECEALCAATEGAWSIGPWDVCLADCESLTADQASINEFIQVVADDVGEFFDSTDHESLNDVTNSAIPALVMAAVDAHIEDFNNNAAFLERDDEASVRIGDNMSITLGDSVVGFVVIVDHHIDHPLFAGAGDYLFINLQGDVVEMSSFEG